MNDEAETADRLALRGELERNAGNVEQKAWLDFFAAAPPEVREALDLKYATVAGLGLLACPAIPITEFNRALAMVSDPPPSRPALMEAIDWLNQHAAPGWALQLGPADTLRGMRPVLADLKLEANTGWCKFAQRLPEADRWTERDDAGATLLDAGAVRNFGETVQTGFGLPSPTAAWFAALVGRPCWHCFLASIDGKPAGAAAVYVVDRAACAGLLRNKPLLEIEEADFDTIIDVNVKGTFLLAQAAARSMVEGNRTGSMVLISSIGGVRASGLNVPYATSKGAINLMGFALADALAPHGIRVNVVQPGVVDTSMTKGVRLDELGWTVALGRSGRPGEIANAAVYLCSPLASYVTASALLADGGIANVI